MATKLIVDNDWKEIPIETGTVRNLSEHNVELSWIRLKDFAKPHSRMKFKEVRLYARTRDNNTEAELAVTPLSIDSDELYGEDVINGGSGSLYVLPTATSTTLGGVKIGNTLTINNGVVNVKNTNSLNNWTSGTSYSTGNTVIYNGKIYQCTTANSDTTFNGSNWQEVGGCDCTPITDWTASTSYKVGDLVIKDGGLYRCTTANSDTAFTATNWELIGGTDIEEYRLWDKFIANNSYSYGDCIRTADTPSGMYWEVTSDKIADWQETYTYAVGDRVKYNDEVYVCTTAHTSTNAFNGNYFTKTTTAGTSNTDTPTGTTEGMYYTSGDVTFVLKHLGGEEETNTISNSAPWEANTAYGVDSLVTYDNSLYICTTAHTSSTDFTKDNEKGYWKQVDPDVTAVTSNGYIQVTKMNVTATKSYDLPITSTKTFCLPPVEVLKFVSGGTAQETEMTFDASDSSEFTDNDYVEFDGTMHEKTEYDYPMSLEESIADTDDTTVTQYVSITDDYIDLDGFKSVSGFSVS